MYKEAGAKPDSGDMAGRCGRGRHTVVSYWKVSGDSGDTRGSEGGSLDSCIEEARVSGRSAAAPPPGSRTAAAAP